MNGAVGDLQDILENQVEETSDLVLDINDLRDRLDELEENSSTGSRLPEGDEFVTTENLMAILSTEIEN